ncbi:hypothetical protein HS088_TW11G00076 [Tripterygium wilfordii]|uniref:PPM-type phosphatase domain-containing protein n=1 Tax=Tripterygium wilfordii TaxID=458696 RepID=A0A7J7D106_TRIWF|nr:hypothetical protein HS088_TW11G00076 [Tripterygium wilfordii]
MFNGLAQSFSLRKGRNSVNEDGQEIAAELAKEAKKNGLILRSSGCVRVDGSRNFASVFSKRGEKGVNQDCSIVWEEFGCQAGMIFCGIFDGHGPWGHFVAKKVRELMPSSLLYNWQQTLAQTLLDLDMDLESDKKHHIFNIWKHSYMKACAAVDQELERLRKIDSFYSGTTALTIVRQVWDVVSNQEAVQIVSSTPDQAKSAKRLVEFAVRAWKRKRRGIAVDDISAICLFFHSSTLSHQVPLATTPK